MKILLVGSNGLLGQKMLEQFLLRPDIQIIATSRNDNKFPATNLFQFEKMDVTNSVETDYIVSKYKPDVIINSAGMTQPDECEKYQSECRKINVLAVNNLIQVSNKVKAHFVQISTDLVFDGNKGLYVETDLPNPINFYGESKLEAEILTQKYAERFTILRTVLIYGLAKYMIRSNLALRVYNQLKQNLPISVVNDQYRTPTLAEDFAKAALQSVLMQRIGIYHISGNEYMNIYEFACKAAQVFGLDSSLIKPVATISINEPARRPLKTGFSVFKAQNELNFKPTSTLEGLKMLKQQIVEKENTRN